MATKRYNPFLVTLHWLIALFVILGLVVGPIMAEMPLAEKIPPLQGHMAVNLVIGLLMLIRLIVRFSTKKPAPVATGNTLFDWTRKTVHFLLYVTVFCMISTGLGMAFMGDLFSIVYGGPASTFPEGFNFNQLPPRAGHGFFAAVLMVLVALHVLGALYHQFIRKDKLLSRMWFGKR